MNSMALQQTKPRRIKTSLTIRADLWSRIDHEKNKSKIMNNALELYFAHKQYMAAAEQAWLEQMAIEGLISAKNDPLVEMHALSRQSVDTVEDFLYRLAS